MMIVIVDSYTGCDVGDGGWDDDDHQSWRWGDDNKLDNGDDEMVANVL